MAKLLELRHINVEYVDEIDVGKRCVEGQSIELACGGVRVERATGGIVKRNKVGRRFKRELSEARRDVSMHRFPRHCWPLTSVCPSHQARYLTAHGEYAPLPCPTRATQREALRHRIRQGRVGQSRTHRLEM